MATSQTPRKPPKGAPVEGYMDARHRAGNADKNQAK